jgi:hypothetical protein
MKIPKYSMDLPTVTGSNVLGLQKTSVYIPNEDLFANVIRKKIFYSTFTIFLDHKLSTPIESLF